MTIAAPRGNREVRLGPTEFLEAEDNCDPDMNLLFRWDWREADPEGNEWGNEHEVLLLKEHMKHANRVLIHKLGICDFDVRVRGQGQNHTEFFLINELLSFTSDNYSRYRYKYVVKNKISILVKK